MTLTKAVLTASKTKRRRRGGQVSMLVAITRRATVCRRLLTVIFERNIGLDWPLQPSEPVSE